MMVSISIFHDGFDSFDSLKSSIFRHFFDIFLKKTIESIEKISKVSFFSINRKYRNPEKMDRIHHYCGHSRKGSASSCLQEHPIGKTFAGVPTHGSGRDLKPVRLAGRFNRYD